MGTNNTRGKILRSRMDLGKQNLIGKEIFNGEINRSYLTQKRFKVTEKSGSHYTIISDKPIEELQAKEKYKGCAITPLI